MDNLPEELDFSVLPDVSGLPPNPDPEEQLLAAHMEARWNALRYIFGKTYPEDGVWTPQDPELLWNWVGGAFVCFPPRRKRNNWDFVTHGLSQPMEDDLAQDALNREEDLISGLGIELVISTRDFCNWAPDVLANIVKYLLFYEDSRVILPGDRLPCNGPIVLGTDTLITYLLAVTSPEYPSEIRLPGGLCSLVHLVGVTEPEIKRAQRKEGVEGSLVLQHVLQKLGVGCLTDPERSCLTMNPQFEQAWSEAEHDLK